ncbi:hypothetical protein M9Y10_015585 [Tritrichomonas musculus]|uniref:Oxidoreductase, short chain dehydrogenase/reductase family protein n=1 Tax=Tritrichomonas musculus TaxID=1915356 RepID=A0ABR2L2P0_9EUKA
MKRNVWFVTGASQGIGLSLVKELLNQNYKVAATSRSIQRLTQSVGKEENDNFLPIEVDLTNENSVKDSVSKAVTKFGTIDVLVNNAGHGFRGALEETSIAESRQLFEDNYFSMISVLHQVLPIMRQNHNGLIFNVSSIQTLITLPYSSQYCATKAAIVAMSTSLAEEVKDFNIKVVPVEPGPFETNFCLPSNLSSAKNMMHEYDQVRERSTPPPNNKSGKRDGDPDRAAKVFIDIAKLEESPKLLMMGKMCLDFSRKKIDEMNDEREKWKEYTARCSYE